MAPWRTIRVRKLLAVVALLGALQHVALVPRHAVMQIAAASVAVAGGLSDAEQWAADLEVPICHRAIATAHAATAENDTTKSDSNKPAKPAKRLGQCLVCASVLAAVAYADVEADTESRPQTSRQLYVSLQAAGADLPGAAAFYARGPPAAA